MSSGSFKADFSPKVGSKKRAAGYFIMGVLGLVVIPVILMLFSQELGTLIASLIPMFKADDLTAAMDLVKDVSVTYLLFGLPILLLTIPIGFYPDGSWSRLTFRLISGFYALFWVYMIVRGGVMTINATDLAHSISEGVITSLNIVADFSGFIIIILGLIALKNIVPIAEFYGARDEYLHGPKKKKKDGKREVDRTARVRGRHPEE